MSRRQRALGRPHSQRLTPAAARRAAHEHASPRAREILSPKRLKNALAARPPTQVIADWNGYMIAALAEGGGGGGGGAVFARPDGFKAAETAFAFIRKRCATASGLHLPQLSPRPRRHRGRARRLMRDEAATPCVSTRSPGAAIISTGRAAGSRWSMRSIGTRRVGGYSPFRPPGCRRSDLLLRTKPCMTMRPARVWRQGPRCCCGSPFSRRGALCRGAEALPRRCRARSPRKFSRLSTLLNAGELDFRR